MTLSEILKDAPRANIKVGGASGYFYIGPADDAAYRYIQLKSKVYLNHCNEKYNRMRNEVAELRLKKKKAKGKEKKVIEQRIRDILDSDDYAACRDALPWMTRKVIDTYPSIVEPDTMIIIIDSQVHGNYWTSDEFNADMGRKPFRF